MKGLSVWEKVVSSTGNEVISNGEVLGWGDVIRGDAISSGKLLSQDDVI